MKVIATIDSRASSPAPTQLIGGEVAPQHLVHHAEDDEGEQRDADRDLDGREDPDEPRVGGNALVELGRRVEGVGVPVDGVAERLGSGAFAAAPRASRPGLFGLRPGILLGHGATAMVSGCIANLSVDAGPRVRAHVAAPATLVC